ncbi:MAG TPA: PAS domain S-box protein [Paludibacter sp.]
MKHKEDPENNISQLNAQNFLENKPSRNDIPYSEADILKLAHELSVHQVELELQNEELKEARAAAQDVTTRYTELYDFAPLGYFSLSMEGEIIEINISGSQMLGIDRSVIKANRFGYFVSAETRPIFNIFLKRIFEKKTKETCEVSLSIQPGFQIDVQLTGTISGNCNHCLVIAIDITNHKQSENKIQLSETRYRRLFESAKDGILVLDAESGMITDVNPFLIDLLGYSKESFVDKEIWEIGFFKDIAANKDKFLEWQQKRYVRYENLPLRTFDGQMINVEFVSNVYYEGKKEVIQCNIRDITTRVLVEEALKKNEEKLRFISANISDVIWIYNFTQTKLTYISPSVFQFSGYIQNEAIAQGITKLLSPESAKRVVKDLPIRVSEFLNGIRKTYTDQFQIICKDEIIKWSESVTKYRLAKDESIEIYGVTRDITRRKLVEAEIQLKNEDLQRINAEKDKFFSIIAHDLRGPFSAFFALTELLAEGFSTMEQLDIQNLAISMRKSAGNLFSLLENLLMWSRMQRGLDMFVPELHVLRPKILQSLVLVMEDASKKEIKVNFDIPADLVVFADSNMLDVIIRNLVSNAVKFTPIGGSVTISAKQYSNKPILISIKDTGIGMSKKMINNLFRLDVNTSRRGTEGELSSGLGLILCRDFVEKHGGVLRVESEEGKGSTFLVILSGEKDCVDIPN